MTKFWLCENIPFNNSYDNVVGFDNETQQQSYFIGLSVGGPQPSNNFRIIDNKVTIRVDRSYDECKELNYMVLLQGGKYYYLFIDSIGYIDNVTTQVNASIDVWQTYMFDYDIKDALIEREHQDRFKMVDNKLEPIYNLEIENIELGEMYDTVNRNVYYDSAFKGATGRNDIDEMMWLYIITLKPIKSSDSTYTPEMRTINNMVTGTYVYTIPFNTHFDSDFYFSARTSNGGRVDVKLKNHEYIEDIISDPNVYSMYISRLSPFPYKTEWGSWGETDKTVGQRIVEYLDSDRVIGNNGMKFIITNGLIPVRTFKEDNKIDISNIKNVYDINNNIRNIDNEVKLKTKPFTLYTITNGTSEVIDFGLNELEDKIIYTETHSLDYKSFMGFNKNDMGLYYGENSTKNSELPLTNDRYLDYKSRNKATATTGIAINTATALAGGVLVGTGVGSFIGTGLMISGTQKIINEMIRQSDLKQSPRSVREMGNNIIHSLNVLNSREVLNLNIIERRVKEQFYNKAYEYMYRLGYKANRFGVPNLKSRTIFNFIKTIDVTIGGGINQNIKALLENMFNNGMRIWHYRDSNFRMYNYENENWEVSLL